MTQNLVLFNLEYTYLINTVPSSIFSTSNKIWKDYDLYDPLGTNSCQVMDNFDPINRTALVLSQSPQDFVSVLHPFTDNSNMSIAINGTDKYVTKARNIILKSYKRILSKRIKLNEFELNALKYKKQFLKDLDVLSRKYETEISICDFDTDFKSFGQRTNEHYIYILGNHDNVNIAESKARLLVDVILKEFQVDALNISLSSIPLFGGVGLFKLDGVARQLNANIYVPDLLPELFNSGVIMDSGCLQLYISAKGIQEIVAAKIMLQQLLSKINNDESNLVSKALYLSKLKLDYLTLYRQHDMLDLMFKYGTFVQFPSLGEDLDLRILVQGRTEASVQETINEIISLSTLYYKTNVCFKSPCFKHSVVCVLKDLSPFYNTCAVTYNEYGIEICGINEELKQFYKLLQLSGCDSRKIIPSIVSLKSTMEIDNEQKGFICGKKNGKTLKILNQCSNASIIRFHPLSEFYSVLELCLVIENDAAVEEFLHSMTLLELELPAELMFNVPDIFHKSIIGNGGMMIQSIMKKYNVFIKFFSHKCKKDIPDRDFKNKSNVLVKCPKKNASNLLCAKKEIDMLFGYCFLNNKPISNGGTVYNTTYFELWKSHYVLMNKGPVVSLINQLENDTGTYIQFPDSLDSFGDEDKIIIAIKGSENRSKVSAHRLMATLPSNYKFKITYCPSKFHDQISYSNEEFNEKILLPFRILLSVEISIRDILKTHHEILLSYLPHHAKCIESAKDNMTLYLREKGFLILEKQGYLHHHIIDTPQSQEVLRPITNRIGLSSSNSRELSTRKVKSKRSVGLRNSAE